MKVTIPTTGLVEAEYPLDSQDQVEAKLALAQQAHITLRRMSFAERAELMLAAAGIVEAEVETTAAMVTREMGKPISQSKAEVLKCAKNMRYYAKNAEAMLTDWDLEEPAKVGASKAGSIWQPLGVVLAVMPWNYPLWQVMRFAAPALMAGNSGVLKHSSNVPESALYLHSLFSRAGFPEGSFGALMIPASAVEAIIDDWRVRATTLTGSEPAGRAVAERSGKMLKPSVQELGGSDPFIVTPSADLNKAVSVAITARINNNGQSCIAGKRFLVFDEVYEEFLEKFVAGMEALVMGDPMQEETQLGPLATASGLGDLEELVADAKAKGARILCGGDRASGEGYFYPATVIDQISPDMRLRMEEAFGPVASVYRVSSREEAVELANETAFGLSSSVWTTNEADEAYFVRELQAGAVFINGMTISYPELPFGGIKDSGFGRELSDAGIKEFCNLKTVWKA
jgi:succinate-semialdehyde dehydrogenase/glutarate-semialdehyde dehydrogenase